MLVGNEYNVPWVRLGEKRDFLRDTCSRPSAPNPLEPASWLLPRYRRKGACSAPCVKRSRLSPRQTRPDLHLIDIGGRSARYPVYNWR